VTRRWTLRFAAGFGVLTVLVSGCTEKQQANESLPSASTTSALASPDELPPLGPEDFPMPDEARTKDAAGAEAFLRYYFDLYDLAKRNLSSTYLREFSRNCSTCSRLADQIDSDSRAGYTYRGGGVRIEAISPPLVRGSEAQVAVSIVESPLTVLEDGRPVKGLSFPERRSPSSGAILSWNAGESTWLLKQLGVA
jgi:hypothetical protein